MNEKVRWTNLKIAEVVKLFAAKGWPVSRFIIKQLSKLKGFVTRSMSKVLTIKEVANRARAVSKYSRQNCPVQAKRIADLEC